MMMTMNKSKRILSFITFFICTTSLALLAASLTTHKWIVVRPLRVSLLNDSTIKVYDSNREDLTTLVTPDLDTSVTNSKTYGYGYNNETTDSRTLLEKALERRKYRGQIHFGLFQGSKILNYGFGDRSSYITMKEELLRNPNLMPFGLWLFTVLCVAIAIIFGLVSSIFAIINTVMAPGEVISGIHGLFLWNGMGALFCTGACVSWLIQFRTKLRKNVLTPDEIDDGWSSENRARLGLSFFFVVVALALFLLNVILVMAASSRRGGCCCRKTKETPHPFATDKTAEGVIMLY